MTLAMEDRFKRYTRHEVIEIMSSFEYDPEDISFLTAISNYAVVTEIPELDKRNVGWMRTVDVPVVEVPTQPTGIYSQQGQPPMILLNVEQSIMDYDFVSALHPQHDWDVYLWLAYPYTSPDLLLGVMGEWFRRDVYPDRMRPFNGKELDWEDQREESKYD